MVKQDKQTDKLLTVPRRDNLVIKMGLRSLLAYFPEGCSCFLQHSLRLTDTQVELARCLFKAAFHDQYVLLQQLLMWVLTTTLYANHQTIHYDIQDTPWASYMSFEIINNSGSVSLN